MSNTPKHIALAIICSLFLNSTYSMAADKENTCFKKTEKFCLKAASSFVKREGKTLTVKSENGQSKTYRSRPEFCSTEKFDDSKCVVYSLEAFYPEQHGVIIDASMSECGGKDLVNLQNGQSVGLTEAAATDMHFSADGSSFVSVDWSEGCSRNFDIAIWSWNSAGVAQTFKYNENEKDREELWKFVRWIDNNRIELHVQTWVGDETEPYEKTVELHRSGDSWKLDWLHPQPPKETKKPN